MSQYDITEQQKDFYKSLQYNDLIQEYIDACENGFLEHVRYLLTSKDLKNNPHINATNTLALSLACANNHIEVVKYLLTSDELLIKADIRAHENQPLINACSNNNFELVKYLLTSPDLKEHASLSKNDSIALVYACKHDNVEMIKYLLTSEELKDHASIYAVNGEPLVQICAYNCLNVLKFVIEELKVDIYFNNCYAIREASANNYEEMLQYLVFDYGIKKTPALQEHIENRFYYNKTISSLEKMFNIREASEKLEQNLNKDLKVSVHNKIKI